MLELGDAATPAHKEAGQKVVEGGADWFFAMGGFDDFTYGYLFRRTG